MKGSGISRKLDRWTDALPLLGSHTAVKLAKFARDGDEIDPELKEFMKSDRYRVFEI